MLLGSRCKDLDRARNSKITSVRDGGSGQNKFGAKSHGLKDEENPGYSNNEISMLTRFLGSSLVKSRCYKDRGRQRYPAKNQDSWFIDASGRCTGIHGLLVSLFGD